MSIREFKEELDYLKICFMQDNKANAKFTLPLTLLKKLRPYCEEIVDQRMAEYQNNRGHQKNREGLIKDFMRGFVAEFFVYAWWCKILEKNNKSHLVVFPDFSLRKDNQRIHDADVKVGELKIHVKSFFTETSKPWSYSCNFQKNDIDKKFDEKDWLFLVGIDDNFTHVNLEYFCSINFLKENDYLDTPFKESLAKFKYSIYFRELSNRNKKTMDIKKYSLKFQYGQLNSIVNK